ncbi:zinc finger family protein [Cucumis melo var. makuwa]|uniref:Zinc finger family protein n=1 Tax=Cucumis melo var. makuwa TaxID=1194695 RepID=A0A5D3DY81_CUCMM|nr:zinc finger family protein [Cucumis melo var. makuwa]
MTWRRVLKSVQALLAHGSLFCFTLLLVLKLDHFVSHSWWVVFFPLWVFHVVVARGRFSLPAPSLPHNRHWAPCHAVVATPLLIAFELLLCVYLESLSVYGFAAVNLKIVFLPLLAFEIIILIDNFRSLMPGDDESMSDEAIWETLPGTPAAAKSMPLPILFSPLFILQGAAVIYAASRLLEKAVLLLRGGSGTALYFSFSIRAHACLEFFHHGSRLLGWWSIDESSREEQARLYHEGASGYNTFSGYPPEVVKKMPKKDLAEEVWRLQAALGEQTEITKYSLLDLILFDFKFHCQWLILVVSFYYYVDFIGKPGALNRKRCYVGFVLREKLAWFFFRVGIAYYAVPALRSVKSAQYVA